MGGAIYIRGMVNQCMDSCCLLSRAGWASARLVQFILYQRFFLWILGAVYTVTTFSQYIILCASHGQQALNGSVLLLVTAYLT